MSQTIVTLGNGKTISKYVMKKDRDVSSLLFGGKYHTNTPQEQCGVDGKYWYEDACHSIAQVITTGVIFDLTWASSTNSRDSHTKHRASLWPGSHYDTHSHMSSGEAVEFHCTRARAAGKSSGVWAFEFRHLRRGSGNIDASLVGIDNDASGFNYSVANRKPNYTNYGIYTGQGVSAGINLGAVVNTWGNTRYGLEYRNAIIVDLDSVPQTISIHKAHDSDSQYDSVETQELPPGQTWYPVIGSNSPRNKTYIYTTLTIPATAGINIWDDIV